MAQTELYAKVYKQVIALMDRLPDTDRERIPDEVYEFYKKNMDASFAWEYDDTLPLEEQDLMRETNAVMVKIFRDFFATPKQKGQLGKVLEKNEKIAKKQQYENMMKGEKTKERKHEKTAAGGIGETSLIG